MHLPQLIEFLTKAERRCVESLDGLDLPDPSPDSHELFVGNAEFEEETYWIICRRHARKLEFVGRGTCRMYVECCYFGCPELVRQDCVLNRQDVLEFAELIPSIEQLTDPWHWVPFDEMFA